MSKPNEWDRQPGEPAKWYAIFRDYFLPQGTERSLEQAFRSWQQSEAPRSKAKRPNPSWYSRATQWHWVDRAHAWDMAQSAQALAEAEDEIVTMKKRHIRGSLALQAAALKRLESIAANPGELTASEALRYFREAIEIERQARGLPKEILEVWNLTDDEILRKYQELYTGLAAVSGLGSGNAGAGDTDPA